MEELLKQLESIRRWKWLVITVGVLAMAAALAVTLSRGSSFDSSATLIVGASNQAVNRAPEQDALLGRGYAAQLNKPTLQQPLRERANIPDDVTITAASIESTPFLEITASSDSPEKSVSAATAFANVVVTSTFEALGTINEQRLAPLNDNLTSVLTQIAATQAQLADPALSAAQRATAQGRLGALQTQAQVIRGNLETQISPSGNPNAVGLFAKAVNAEEKTPAVTTNAILGLLGGLVLGGAIALMLGALELRISSPSVVRSKLGLPTLASVSGVDARQRQEDLQGLASGMALMASGITSVAVTSPGIGEGKTMVASNLARYRAALGDRVILIDGNLRASASDSRAARELGLTELLESDGEMRVREALVESGIDNLRILPAGVAGADPYAVVTGDRIARVLESLSAYADLLVIDTAALLSASESQVMCSYADRTILVLDAAGTQTSAAVDARDVLQRVQARILGVVLTRVSKRRAARTEAPRSPGAATPAARA